MKSHSFFIVSWITWVLFGVSFQNLLDEGQSQGPFTVRVLLDPQIEDPQTWLQLLPYLPGSITSEVIDKDQMYQKIQKADPRLAESIQLVGPEILPTEVVLRFNSFWPDDELPYFLSVVSQLPGVIRVTSNLPKERPLREQILQLVMMLMLLGIAILGEVEAIAPLGWSGRWGGGLALALATVGTLRVYHLIATPSLPLPRTIWLLGAGILILAWITPPESRKDREPAEEPPGRSAEE